jgi:hypothetical protein
MAGLVWATHGQFLDLAGLPWIARTSRAMTIYLKE